MGMFPGLSAKQLNEGFTAEQLRSLRGAWDGYQEKRRDAEDVESGKKNFTSPEEFAAMMNG
jgi:hypothetical protein